MQYDGSFDLAVGMSRETANWRNKKYTWSEFVNRLKEAFHTNETLKEFLGSSKEEQLKIKDVGGYVGGYLRNGKRKPENVLHRQLLTLDIDFAHSYFWGDFTLLYSNAAILHGTHKHSEPSPRYRLIIPLSRPCTPDEYSAIARKVAGTLGIDSFDSTTFQTQRLMFWQSSPKDVPYYFEVQDGEWLDADGVLNSYVDWQDTSSWATSSTEVRGLSEATKKQEDPELKKGVIGAFCRTYSISEVISEFLSDEYTPTTFEDRYTYSKGSTAAGLIVYDDKFAYSHHGTDPCSGKLCNAFDLVRIHKYGHLDSSQNDTTKSKSFKAMEDFILKDKATKGTLAVEKMESVKYDFADVVLGEEKEVTNLDWLKEMEIDSKGKYLSTSSNINLIFSNDEYLKKQFCRNMFDGKGYIFKSLPWRKLKSPEPIRDVDYAGVRNYIESVYGISGALKIDDVIALEFEKNHFHPVKDYLNSLVWDGVSRVDTLLIDYLGAENNLYSREAIRKMLTAAVARIFNAGVKFDLVLTLVGKQGTGKSTFFRRLGGQWFSDSFYTVQGREALEQIQGAWLIEMAELSGLRKAEVESVKHFISKQEDSFRPAYGHTLETFPRQCVFLGTTNNKDFLRDPSGNRRFMPVDIDLSQATKNVFTELGDEVSQIWAEAVVLYKKGEVLYLSPEAEKIACLEQKAHSEWDERVGIIDAYLDTNLPEDWYELDHYDRRAFLSKDDGSGVIKRKTVCVAEIWCECLGREKEAMDRYKTREINWILKTLDNWEQSKSTKNFKCYGTQKYYSRK